MTVTGKKLNYLGTTPIPVPLYPSHVSHGLTWNRTEVSVMKASD